MTTVITTDAIQPTPGVFYLLTRDEQAMTDSAKSSSTKVERVRYADASGAIGIECSEALTEMEKASVTTAIMSVQETMVDRT